MRKQTRRGISLGTITMLTLTALVLVGFFALLPSFTGRQDILLDATKLAVAMDQSLSQLSMPAVEQVLARPSITALPPQSFATTAPQTGPTPVPTPVPTAVPQKQTFSLCAAGSVLWDDSVRKALTYDGEYRFDILTDQLSDAMRADLSIVTLEHTLIAENKLTSVNMPAEMLMPIRNLGVTHLSLGHENILNGGIAGAAETAQAVQRSGMHPIGVTAGDAQRNATVDLSGVQVALLSYQDEVSSTGHKQTTEAERAAALSPIVLDSILTDIRSVRSNGANVVVVNLCWGKEGASNPTDEQVQQAQAMADAGADIILGTYPGVLQPVKVLSADRGDGQYHPVLCAYSLGHLFSPKRDSRTTISSILLKADVVYDPLTGSVAFDNLSYTPTYCWRGKEDGKTLVRILTNDNEHYPEFVDNSQREVMERSFKLITGVMEDSGIPMAQ